MPFESRTLKPLVTTRKKFFEYWRIIGIILLQDMRTRYGTSYISYLIAIVWPLTHLYILMGAYLLRVAVAPIGDSPTIFIATGLVPFIFCLYPCRFIGIVLLQNKQLMGIPTIKPIQLIIARCILETIGSIVVGFILIISISFFDIDVYPIDLAEAVSATFAAIFVGLSFGCFAVTLTAALGQYAGMGVVLAVTVLYIFSGVYIPASSVSNEYLDFIRYNPLFHLVIWLRGSYTLDTDAELLEKGYVLFVACVLLFIGLGGERALRGKVIQ